MLEILKSFDAVGIAIEVGQRGNLSHHGYISLKMMTAIDEASGIPFADLGFSQEGEAVVKVTVPMRPLNEAVVKTMELGDIVRAWGFVCMDRSIDGRSRGLVLYASRIDHIGQLCAHP